MSKRSTVVSHQPMSTEELKASFEADTEGDECIPESGVMYEETVQATVEDVSSPEMISSEQSKNARSSPNQKQEHRSRSSHQRSSKTSSKRKRSRTPEKRSPTPEKKSKPKGNSAANPAKGKSIVKKTIRDAIPATETFHANQEEEQPQLKSWPQTTTVIRALTAIMLGVRISEYLALTEYWTQYMNTTLYESDMTADQVAYLVQFMDWVLEDVMKIEWDLDSLSPKWLSSCLVKSKDISSLKYLEPEVCTQLRTLFQAYRMSRKPTACQSNIEPNNSTKLASTTLSGSNISMPSTSAPGTIPLVGVDAWRTDVGMNSVTGELCPSVGWTRRVSNSSSFITWVDESDTYSVRWADNAGEILIKTEIYRTSDIEGLPTQDWWRHALHRSRLYTRQNNPMLVPLRGWVQGIQTAWVMPDGTPRYAGVTAERADRSVLTQRMRPVTKKEEPSPKQNGGGSW